MSNEQEQMECEVANCVWKARLRDLISQIRANWAQLSPPVRADYQKLMDQVDMTELELDMEEMSVV